MIFDAIAFALYGKTSGGERDPLRMHCDLVSPAVDTVVKLVFIQNGREYTVERTLHFSKKRGTEDEYNDRLYTKALDLINEAIATWDYYPKGTTFQQMVPVDETFVKAGHGATVKPTIKKIEDISQNDMHNYLCIENLTITPTDDTRKYNMMDEDEETILLYNQFKMELPEFDPNATYDVEGFLSIYKDEREIFVNKVTKHGGFLKGDVNGDGSVNITDVNMLINIILGATMDAETMKRADVNVDGSYNISDINEVIAYILSH
jgi:hypothetical protein